MNCPICGSRLKTKVSFKVPNCTIDKRETLICDSCSFSTIKETNQERDVRVGKLKTSINIL